MPEVTHRVYLDVDIDGQHAGIKLCRYKLELLCEIIRKLQRGCVI